MKNELKNIKSQIDFITNFIKENDFNEKDNKQFILSKLHDLGIDLNEIIIY